MSINISDREQRYEKAMSDRAKLYVALSIAYVAISFFKGKVAAFPIAELSIFFVVLAYGILDADTERGIGISFFALVCVAKILAPDTAVRSLMLNDSMFMLALCWYTICLTIVGKKNPLLGIICIAFYGGQLGRVYKTVFTDYPLLDAEVFPVLYVVSVSVAGAIISAILYLSTKKNIAEYIGKDKKLSFEINCRGVILYTLVLMMILSSLSIYVLNIALDNSAPEIHKAKIVERYVIDGYKTPTDYFFDINFDGEPFRISIDEKTYYEFEDETSIIVAVYDGYWGMRYITYIDL